MTITEADVIDVISFENATGDLVLTVSDHLDWRRPQKHIEALEQKLNAYLEYLESADAEPLLERAKGHAVVIRVVGKFPLDAAATEYLREVGAQLKREGIVLRHEHLEGEEG